MTRPGAGLQQRIQAIFKERLQVEMPPVDLDLFETGLIRLPGVRGSAPRIGRGVFNGDRPGSRQSG